MAAPTARLFAVLILTRLCLCALAPVALAQSSTSETPINDSHRSTGPVHGDYHAVGLFRSKTQPIYPPAAIAAGISGTVVLDAIILGTGILADVRVLSGPPMLQQESLKAVRTWRCPPYLLNGVPTVRKFKINLIFTLEEDGRATIKTTASEPEVVKAPSPADDAKPPESK
ncbi:MAG: energy transducer TonB [Terracidiphilus sp.]